MSLIEITIGVIILALVLIPAMNVITGGTKSVISTRDHVQAVFISQQIIERLRTYPFKFLDEDHPGLTSAEKAKTFESEMKNLNQYKQYNVNNILYEIKNFDIKEAAHQNVNVQKSFALVSFEIEYVGKDGKRHGLDFHTAVAQME